MCVSYQVSRTTANLFTGTEVAERLSEHQNEVLLLHKWPEKHKKKARESGLGGLVDKYEFDSAKLSPEEARKAEAQAAASKKLEITGRKSMISGARTDPLLRQIDGLALQLQSLEANGNLNPRYSRWRSDLADIEDAFIEDPAQITHLLAGVKVKMLSAAEKRVQVQKLAAKLQHDHITAIAPQVWKRKDYLHDPDMVPSQAENLVNRLGFVFMAYQMPMWWWECVERFHMFLMTAGLVFIYPESPAQLAAGAMISFLFLMANMIKRPYCTDFLNFLKMFSLFAQFMTLFAGIMMSYIQAADTVGNADKQIDHVMVTIIIILTNITVMMLPLMKPLLSGDSEEYAERAMKVWQSLSCLKWNQPSMTDMSRRSSSASKRSLIAEPPLWKLQLQQEGKGKDDDTCQVAVAKALEIDTNTEANSNHDVD